MFAINHLHVRAPKRDIHALVNELQQTSWPSIDERQWLFIRAINVNSDRTRLRRQASTAVGDAISSAVDGRLEPAASANSVRFKNYVELLACLLRDLLQGKANACWYWHRWSYLFNEPTSLAVTRLLWEESAYLSSLLPLLAKHNIASQVWCCLNHASAKQIITRLRVDLSPHNIEQYQADHAVIRDVGVRTRKYLLSRPEKIAYWPKILRIIEVGDARWQLAAVIACSDICPLELRRMPLATIQEFIRCASGLMQPTPVGSDVRVVKESTAKDSLPKPPLNKSIQHASVDNKKHQASDIIPDQSANSALESVPVSETNQEVAATQNLTSSSRDYQLHTRTNKISPITNDQPPTGAAIDNVKSLIAPTDEDPLIVGDTFNTYWGGIFYLINALTLTGDKFSQHFLQETTAASGWYCLFQLSRCFGVNLDPPLLHYLAHCCAYAGVEELTATPEEARYRELFLQLQKYFHEESLWSSRLLKRPATVVASSSHIDVFFRAQDVDLAVRLAGLDINPSWVPWLGRVVAFHYRGDVDRTTVDGNNADGDGV